MVNLTRLIVLCASAMLIMQMGTTVLAQQATLKTGERTYKADCMACHGRQSSVEAPKLGDRKVWAPLIEEGQHIITAHGFVGVRAMPPRGGNPELSLEEFGRAVAYMARAAGADWKDPDLDQHLMQRIRQEEHKRRAEKRD